MASNSGTQPIDFSDLGGKPVGPPPPAPAPGPIDFSDLGGKPVTTGPPPVVATPATPRTVDQKVGGVLREGMLGAASGAGLPETSHASDFTGVPGLWNIIKHPVESAKLVGGSMYDSQNALFEKGQQELRSEGLANKFSGVVHAVGAAIPLLGPATVGAGEEVGQGIKSGDPEQIAHGLGSASAQLAMLGLGTKTGEGVTNSVVDTVGGGVVKGATAGTKAVLNAGKNATGIGLSGQELMNKAGGPSVLDRGFSDAVDTAGPRIAEQNKIKPIKSAENMADGAHEAADRLYKQFYHPQIDRNATAVIDGSPIGDKIRSGVTDGMRDLFPEKAQRATDFASKFDGPITIAKASDYLQTLNAELKGYYRMTPDMQHAAGMTSGSISAMEDAAAGLRTAIDDKLTANGETDPTGLRQQYGALKQIQKVFDKRAVVNARHQGSTLQQQLTLLGGGGEALAALMAGHPLAALGGVGSIAASQIHKYFNAPDMLAQRAANAMPEGPPLAGGPGPQATAAPRPVPPQLPATSATSATSAVNAAAAPGARPAGASPIPVPSRLMLPNEVHEGQYMPEATAPPPTIKGALPAGQYAAPQHNPVSGVVPRQLMDSQQYVPTERGPIPAGPATIPAQTRPVMPWEAGRSKPRQLTEGTPQTTPPPASAPAAPPAPAAATPEPTATGVHGALQEIDKQFPVNPNNPGAGTNPKEYASMGKDGPNATFTVAENDGRLRLKGIQTLKPGTGAGNSALRSITDIADKHGVTMELTASPYGDEATRLGKDNLVKWYGQHGFVPEPGTDPALGYMVREPQGATSEPSLPGMENHVAERATVRSAEAGASMTADLAQPKGNIERAAGAMESNSPLFRGTGASPQNEMFGGSPESEPAATKPDGETMGRPSAVRMVQTKDLTADPATFQWRQMPRPTIPEGAPWDQDKAGPIDVWRDPADNKVKVVDGHHRYNHAVATGTPEIEARFHDFANAAEAKRFGAEKNLEAGNATPFDAASYLRQTGTTTGALAARGINLTGDVIKKGSALSNLSDAMWDKYRSGEIDENKAVAVGGLDDPKQQAALAQMATSHRLSAADLQQQALRIKEQGNTATTTQGLFGDQEDSVSNAVATGRLASKIDGALRGETSALQFISKADASRQAALARGKNIVDMNESAQQAAGAQQLAEHFNRVQYKSGPVGSILEDAGKRVTQGEKLDGVFKEIYPQIRAAIGKELGQAPEGGEPAPGATAPAPAAHEPRPMSDDESADFNYHVNNTIPTGPQTMSSIRKFAAENSTEPISYLNSGTKAVVFDLKNGNVMRVSDEPPSTIKSPDVIAPIKTEVIQGASKKVHVGIYPWVDTSGITEADSIAMTKKLDAQGLSWDAATYNLGRLPDGRVIVIDADAVKEGEKGHY